MGRLIESFDFLSDRFISLVWKCCSSLCLRLCAVHERSVNVVLLSRCVLMLGCPAQENSNFKPYVSIERLLY